MIVFYALKKNQVLDLSLGFEYQHIFQYDPTVTPSGHK